MQNQKLRTGYMTSMLSKPEKWLKVDLLRRSWRNLERMLSATISLSISYLDELLI